MRLTIITQYYPPEIGAPQARLSELASFFVQSGHSVVVLTAMPNYPTGKIHPGYGGLWRKEMRDGVKVIRTFIFPTQKVDVVRRLASYLSFVLSSMAIGSVLLRRCDFMLVESPPLLLGISGIWLSRLKCARLIFNVSDLWPESAVSLGVLRPNSLPHFLGDWLEKLCYRHAWLTTGQSKSILADIKNRFSEISTFHLSNGVDTTRFSSERDTPVARSSFCADGECVALYAGLHGLAQGLDQILRAAEILKAEGGCRFVLMGDGPEKRTLQELAQQQQLSNVVFLPPRAAAEMPAVVASADIILVTLKKYIPGAVPSKIYEAMASGRPIVLVADGEAAEIVRHFKAGIVIEPGDIGGLAKAVRILRDNPSMRRELGDNGQCAAKEHFDRAKIAERFADYLESHLNA